MGKLLNDIIDDILGKPGIIAAIMIIGGILLLFVDQWFRNSKIEEVDNINQATAFRIGLFQCLAILFPGLSRSAATIVGGMVLNVSRKAAAEFSFFLAVPTMMAASAKSTLDVYKTNPEVFAADNLITLLIGAVVAFIVALISVQFFIKIVQKMGFAPFGWYRIVLGITILVLLYTNYLC